jgi:hypothetical protein
MFHDIAAIFLKPGGPYTYVRLVTAAYAVSAIGRLVPVKRKQVPGYRRRIFMTARARGGARHRARAGINARPPSPHSGSNRGKRFRSRSGLDST